MISKSKILEKFEVLEASYNENGLEEYEALLEPLEKELIAYLVSRPYEYDTWIKLALACLGCHDYLAALDYLADAWKHTKEYKILLYICIIQDVNEIIREESVDLLKKYFSSSLSKSELAQYYYILGLHAKDTKPLTEALSYFEKAIEHYPSFVRAFWQMTYIYRDMGDSSKALFCREKAVSNVQKVYAEDGYCDLLSIEEFENETIFGVHLTSLTKSIIATLPVQK